MKIEKVKTTKAVISLGHNDGITQKPKTPKAIRKAINSATKRQNIDGYTLTNCVGMFEGSNEQSTQIVIYGITEKQTTAIIEELAKNLNQWEVWSEFAEVEILKAIQDLTA